MVDLSNICHIQSGEVLREEFLKSMRVLQTKAANDTGVSARRINEIVSQKRSITADTPLRLALYFGTTEYFWIGLQDDYDLEEARKVADERIRASVKPLVVG